MATVSLSRVVPPTELLVWLAATPDAGIIPIGLTTDQTVSIHHPGYIDTRNTQILPFRANDSLPPATESSDAPPGPVPQPQFSVTIRIAIRTRPPASYARCSLRYGSQHVLHHRMQLLRYAGRSQQLRKLGWMLTMSLPLRCGRRTRRQRPEIPHRTVY
ncbi:hypothetical protein BDD12DRAFT_875006 [Trichophaea hybrida]|nr:hypothetical protein BDD12DRAFT_875006 [Trichophaea hybrida]